MPVPWGPLVEGIESAFFPGVGFVQAGFQDSQIDVGEEGDVVQILRAIGSVTALTGAVQEKNRVAAPEPRVGHQKMLIHPTTVPAVGTMEKPLRGPCHNRVEPSVLGGMSRVRKRERNRMGERERKG